MPSTVFYTLDINLKSQMIRLNRKISDSKYEKQLIRNLLRIKIIDSVLPIGKTKLQQHQFVGEYRGRRYIA